MRSFFKRPSWASRGEENLASDFYRRADQTYGNVVATTEEVRERPASCLVDNPAEGIEPRKRRHLAKEQAPRDLIPSTSFENVGVTSHQRNSLIPSEIEPSGIPIHNNEPNSCVEQKSSHLDDLNVVDAPVTSEPGNLLHGQKTCTTYLTDRALEIDALDSAADLTAYRDTQGCDEGVNPDSTADAVVQILVSSRLSNTKPLIIQRKMSQSLRDVRLAWCKNQHLPREMQSSVFLTWKGRRLFDVTTCRSLGIHTDTDIGPLIADDYPQNKQKDIRIHMEAVTKDLVASASPAQWAIPAACSEQNREPRDAENTDQLRAIRIVLKCPGFDDYKTSINPNVQISHLVTDFREARGLHAEQNVYFTFDGDRLDPNSCPADYDITHDDLVDVIVR